MASLYELTQDALQLQELLENGDIDETTYNDTLEGLDIDSKVESICKIIRNLEANAVAFKAEKDRLAQRQKQAENSISWLKNSLLTYLSNMNTNKVEAGLFVVSKSISKSVNIVDEGLIPEQYLIVQPPKIDKIGIKEAIKAGTEIPGAEIMEKDSVRIR